MGQTTDALEFPIQSRLQRAFRMMLVLSFLLHILVFFGFFGRTSSSSIGSKASIAFMDLSMSNLVSPQPAKTVEAPKEPAPTLPQAAPVPAPPPPSELNSMQNEIEKSLQPSANQDVIQHLAVGLGATRGFFKSLGEGETLREDIQEYYLELLQNINQKWWLDKNIDRTGVRELILNIVIARDGTVVEKNLLRSSGNAGYDRAVLKALESVSTLPPLPTTYNGNVFFAPVRLVAPLNLLAS